MGEGPVNDLRERGVRVTPQRGHTWRVLAESEKHLSAEEVWERARAGLPLELSTTYWLEALRAAGLVADSRLPEGPRVFEAKSASHPHLGCEGCGEISHPEPEVGRWLLEALNAGSRASTRTSCTSRPGAYAPVRSVVRLRRSA